MASNYPRKWSVIRWASYGLVAGVLCGLIVGALHKGLTDGWALVPAVLSGAGLSTVIAILLASLRNFVRGVM
jgi:hypothetical protein